MGGVARCRGCGERVGATHRKECELGAYATAVTVAQTAAAERAADEDEQLRMEQVLADG